MNAASLLAGRVRPAADGKLIAEYIAGRDNNFNLIRVAAALAVLVTHSFAFVLGTGQAEPLLGRIGITIGRISVDVFFVTSGFLVAASLWRRRNATNYLASRALRVYPGLVVMLLLVVFVVGPLLGRLPVRQYLTDAGTYAYFLQCATLISGIGWVLPGLFESNPFGPIVNPSLWTLPYEIGMYALLLVLWLAHRCAPRLPGWFFPGLLICSIVVLGVLTPAERWFPELESRFPRLAYMFFSGVTYFVLRDRIRLSAGPMYAGFAVIGATLWLLGVDWFYVAYVAFLPYMALYIAFVPDGWIRGYNRFGDYSYGIYIYAAPVQQAIASLVVGVSVASMIAMSAAITCALAFFSWHLVEKPALRLKP